MFRGALLRQQDCQSYNKVISNGDTLRARGKIGNSAGNMKKPVASFKGKYVKMYIHMGTFMVCQTK